MSFVAAVSADNCPVCQHSCNGNGQVMAHGGHHAIHEVCLRAMVASGHAKCPLCRVNVTHINGEGVQIAPAAANARADLSEQLIEVMIEAEADDEGDVYGDDFLLGAGADVDAEAEIEDISPAPAPARHVVEAEIDEAIDVVG